MQHIRGPWSNLVFLLPEGLHIDVFTWPFQTHAAFLLRCFNQLTC